MRAGPEWISEAERCEEEGAILTCGAIIRETLGWGLDEDDDRKDIWMDDARSSIGRGKYETARAIYAYALRVFVNRRSIWIAAADLERNHGDKEALWQVLEKAVEACQYSGVNVKMITGDNIFTAKATATECGILKSDQDMSSGAVIEGVEFRNYTPEHRLETVEHSLQAIRVVRVRPLAVVCNPDRNRDLDACQSYAPRFC